METEALSTDPMSNCDYVLALGFETRRLDSGALTTLSYHIVVFLIAMLQSIQIEQNIKTEMPMSSHHTLL